MVYVIIALALLFIIAPIVAVLPSARQREQAALRKAARGKGINTELTTIEDPDPDPAKYRSGTGKPLPRELRLIAYRRARPRPPNWRRLPHISWSAVRPGHEASAAGPWTWEARPPAEASPELVAFLDEHVGKLPDDVVKVDEEHYVVSVYWRERGGMDAFERLVTFLEGCTAVAAHRPPPPDEDLPAEDDV